MNINEAPPADARYKVVIDEQEFLDPVRIPIHWGKRDVTKPDDRVVNYKFNGRRESIIMTQGGIYPIKPIRLDWQPYDGTFLTCIVETIPEWPNPCECCGMSHDTLDCD